MAGRKRRGTRAKGGTSETGKRVYLVYSVYSVYSVSFAG